MSPDPSSLRFANLAVPQTFNLYAYVTNDPLKYIDIDGLLEVDNTDLATFDSSDGSGDTGMIFAAGGGGGGGTPVSDPCPYATCTNVNATPDPPPPLDPGPISTTLIPVVPPPTISVGVTPSNENTINPCSSANAASLDYTSANGQSHIMQGHVGGGTSGKSLYAGDWTAIQAINSSTLSFGSLAPSIFQRTGMITLQWSAPQPLSWMGISNYIGFDPLGNLTTTNRLVVLADCMTVVTSYPVTD